MASRERIEFDVVGRDSSGSKTFRQVGDAAEKAGDQVEDLGKQSSKAGDEVDGLGDKVKGSGDKTEDTTEKYRGLRHEIEAVEGNVRRLAAEIDRTGNKDLFKDLRKQQSEMRKLSRAKDLLPDFKEQGSRSAVALAAGFAKQLPTAMRASLMSGPGAVVAAAIAVPLVASLGAAIGGAVLGAAGAGGVVGGLLLASKDARVQAAGKALGQQVMGDLEDSAGAFVEPALRGLDILRDGWSDVSGDVDSMLSNAASYVEPLAEGVAGLVRELGPGLSEAIGAAGPVIAEISEGLPEVGAALSDMFSTMADHADEGASAVHWIFAGIEDTIGAVSLLIGGLSTLYRGLVDAGVAAADFTYALYGWMPVIGDQVERNRDRMHELKDGLDRGGEAGAEAGGKIEGGLRKAGEGAAAAEIQVRSLQEILDGFTGATLDARQANRQFEQAVDDAGASVEQNGRTLNAHTEKGRKNQEALDAIARATIRQRDATQKSTGSQEQANAVTAKGRAAFLKAADAMGMEAGKAKALADKLFAIPNVSRTVGVNNKQALTAIARVQSGIDGLHGKDLHVGVYYTTKGDLKLPGGTQLKGLSSGGRVVGPGSDTSDSAVRRLSRDEFVVRARAARHVGYDFLNMLNQADRRPDVLAHASSNWSGTAPGRGGGIDEARIASALARALSRVTLRIDDRTGNYATLLSRGDG